jgi:hypothetical protein
MRHMCASRNVRATVAQAKEEAQVLGDEGTNAFELPPAVRSSPFNRACMLKSVQLCMHAISQMARQRGANRAETFALLVLYAQTCGPAM